MKPIRPHESTRSWIGAMAFAVVALVPDADAEAQAPDSTAVGRARPFVEGGFDDKPYLEGVFGRIRLGGYAEGNASWEREEGATEDLGVEMSRLNLFTSTDLRGRVQVWTEIEFEDGGEEIVLELAQVDLRVHRSLNVRGGILLLPIGRFNLAHDGPRNELPARPLLATELLGSALSQPGAGAFGRFGQDDGLRATYEAYAITGYDDGILLASSDGTRLPMGRLNREDANASPGYVGRWELSRQDASIGLSGYVGAYNLHRVEGIDIDERRDVRIGAADLDLGLLGVRWSGEAAVIEVDVPSTLTGLFASRQAGFFAQASRRLGAAPMFRAAGEWTVVARVDGVDFDRDLDGDSLKSLTIGTNLRPIPETCLKLAFTGGESRDRFNNKATHASWVLGFATYF